MKKTLSVVALLAAVLGLVGCDDYVTPAGAVRTAAEKLYKNDLKGFKDALRGKAREELGSREGMASVRAKIVGISGLRVEDAKLVKVIPVNKGTFQTAIRSYSVNVLGKVSKEAKESRIMTATVLCDIYVMESESAMCRNTTAPCSFKDENELTECRIHDLQ